MIVDAKIDICIDWDGTLVDHTFPNMGKPVPHAWETLHWLRGLGFVNLILLTMRSDSMAAGQNYLSDAVDFAAEQGIVFDSVNDNPHQKQWTDSRKVYGAKYIDDTALGCPTINVPGFYRECVDWKIIRDMLNNFFTEKGLM